MNDDTKTPNTSVLSDMLKAYINNTDKVKGIILQSYGEGNFPSGNPDTPEDGAIYKTLKKAHDDGIVLVDCTQVIAGIVNAEAYASGSWLREVGAVGAFDMTPIAALAKLIYLTVLSSYNDYNWDQSKVEQLMLTNITGEIMDVNKLDTRGKWYLAPGESPAGRLDLVWDGSDNRGKPVGAGVYFLIADLKSLSTDRIYRFNHKVVMVR